MNSARKQQLSEFDQGDGIHSERCHARSSTVAMAVWRISQSSAGCHRRRSALDAHHRLSPDGRLVFWPRVTSIASEATGQSAVRAFAARLARPRLHQPSCEEGCHPRHGSELAGGGGGVPQPPRIRHRRSLPGHGRIVHRDAAVAAKLASRLSPPWRQAMRHLAFSERLELPWVPLPRSRCRAP